MEETARKALANKIFEEMQEFLTQLYGRWQDEKEYEDFADYKAIVAKTFSEKYPVSDISLAKRPFAVTFTLADCVYVITVKATEYSYKRISKKERTLQ